MRDNSCSIRKLLRTLLAIGFSIGLLFALLLADGARLDSMPRQHDLYPVPANGFTANTINKIKYYEVRIYRKVQKLVSKIYSKMTASIPPFIIPTPSIHSMTKVSPIDNMVLVFIPAGSFLMGTSSDSELQPDEEEPQRSIYLDSYWIDLTPVTNSMYHLCIDAGKCEDITDSLDINPHFNDPAYADYPVVYVSWFNARDYCIWVGGHLPTEAQWEKAARGSDGRLYPWGNDPPDATLLNYDNLYGGTTKVGHFPNGASPYGVLDLVGVDF